MKSKAKGPVAPSTTPGEHFAREKARRAGQPAPESDAMLQARRQYDAQLAANAAKGRGGRPKKQPAPPPDADGGKEDEAGSE
jgi:hypothetical protein